MKNSKLYFILLALLLASCFNQIRDDGTMAYGEGFYPMLYFESPQTAEPFIGEILKRFGEPNGEDPRFKWRLVWEGLENKDLYNQPIRMVIDTSGYTDKGKKRIRRVSIAIMEENGENILIKKTEKQKALKQYFQEIIDEKMK